MVLGLNHLKRAISRDKKKEQEGNEESEQPLQQPHNRSAAPERPKRKFGPSADIRFPHAIVKANFVPRQEDELAAQECDLVALLRRVDDNWYQACTMDKTKVGYIPRNYLEVLIDIDAPSNLNLNEYVSAMAREVHFDDSEVLHTPTAPISPTYQNVTDSGKAYTPRTPPTTPVVRRKLEKMREPDDFFFTVLETFNPESEDDIGANVGEVMLWIDDEALLGQPMPEAWIYCMNLVGRTGTFPGNFAQALDSSSKIESLLRRAPHAIATRTIRYAPEGYVRIEKDEAMYIDRLDDQFIYGRTASGDIGKLPLTHCDVVVRP
ncbi:hypothetical protein Aperf_G00000033875 [Anoplocephala perfoliata]